MNKKETKKALKVLLASTEFEELTKKFDNKAERLKEQIKQSYIDNKLDREVKFSKKDRIKAAIDVYNEIASELPMTDGWEIMREELLNRIDNAWKTITNTIVDEIGIPYTSLMFTENDIYTTQLTEYIHNTKSYLENMIAQLDAPKKEKDEDVYE